MKKYILVIIMLITLYFGYSNKKENEGVINQEEKVSNVDSLMVNMSSFNEKDMPLSEFLEGVLACEMPALFMEDALKSGVVAARTFYLYNYTNNENYIPTSSGQCYITKEELKTKWGNKYEEYLSKIKKVVKETENEVIVYNDEVIEAFYFSMSNGYTEDASNVFNISKPYLVSVSSSYDKDINNNFKEYSVDLSRFKSVLGLEEESIVINNIIRNQSNRILKICVNLKCYTGVEFRKLFGLRSTDFDVNIENDMVSFVTRGYGHGVGMSQYGANEMAKLGYNYKEILKYYYKGTEIMYK